MNNKDVKNQGKDVPRPKCERDDTRNMNAGGPDKNKTLKLGLLET